MWTFARAVLAFNSVLLIAFAPITASLARALFPSADRVKLTLLATVLTVCNYGLFRVFTYGLETGLYLIVAGLCILVSVRLLRSRPTLAGVVGFGTCAGAAALTRIDFLVVLAGFLAVAWMRRQIGFRDAALAGTVALGVASPWLLWVHRVTGGWMPTSGQSQMETITAATLPTRLPAMVWALAQHASPWLYPELVHSLLARLRPHHDNLWKVTVALALIPAAFLVARIAARTEVGTAWPVITTWFWAVAMLVPIYLLFFWPTYFYMRYTTLLILFAIPVFAAGVHAIAGPRLPAPGVVCAGLGLFLATAALTLHRGATGNSLSVTAHLIETQVSKSEKVGAFSSGVSGYFFRNVVNLDGKVNREAMKARREGRLGRYINEEGITVLLDWPETIRVFVPDAYLEQCWEPCAIRLLPEQGNCYRRRPCAEGRW
jgi:hypothetical protein